jgi:cytochrome oxidase assembly protein ShyY1
VLVRLRVVGGAPAYEVLTAFAVEGGPTVLVNRGYVRPEHGTDVPPIQQPPPGTVNITARLRDSETAGDKPPLNEAGFAQVYVIDTRQIAALTKTPLTGSYLQLVDDQPGGLGALPLPQLDAGPFLSYGIQWIAFGILAPLGLGYFLYSEIRMRRREAAHKAERQASTAPLTAEDKLADRYGRRR